MFPIDLGSRQGQTRARMRTPFFNLMLCLMLVLQGLPMMPVAQAQAPCPAMATHDAMAAHGAMAMHAAKAMPCVRCVTGSGNATGQRASTVRAPHMQGPDCMNSCAWPCQANVPAGLVTVATFVALRLPPILSDGPRPMHDGIRGETIQRPPIA